MKKLAAIAFLLVAAAAPAQSRIGLFADGTGDRCWADLEPFVELELHLLVFLDDFEMDGGLTALEFRLENWPGNPGYPQGAVTARWNSSLIIGELGEDFSMAFDSPQPGPVVEIGILTVQAFSADWIGENHAVVAGPGLECDCIVVVDGMFDLHEAEGLQFTFNCADNCSCIPGVLQAESDWGRVKALY